MHIPDGFLDAKTAAATGTLAAGGLGVALYQAHRHLPPRKVPLMGLAAAFIFAAQMLNFPVAGGTSGHLLGGVLAAVLLGPGAAVIVLTAVLLVQCFVFADGGITALGANVFNMGLIGGVGGWFTYEATRRLMPGDRGRFVALAVACWWSVVMAAVACAGELAMSGAVPWRTAFPAMAGVHMLIGVGEALITTLAVFAIWQSRPELLDRPAIAVPQGAGYGRRYGEFIAYGLLIALGLAIFVSPLASSSPDGLEKVADTLGFMGRAAPAPHVPAPLPDYEMPGVHWAPMATALAGVVGTLIVFALGWVLARALVPNKQAEGAANSS